MVTGGDVVVVAFGPWMVTFCIQEALKIMSADIASVTRPT